MAAKTKRLNYPKNTAQRVVCELLGPHLFYPLVGVVIL